MKENKNKNLQQLKVEKKTLSWEKCKYCITCNLLVDVVAAAATVDENDVDVRDHMRVPFYVARRRHRKFRCGLRHFIWRL